MRIYPSLRLRSNGCSILLFDLVRGCLLCARGALPHLKKERLLTIECHALFSIQVLLPRMRFKEGSTLYIKALKRVRNRDLSLDADRVNPVLKATTWLRLRIWELAIPIILVIQL